jgi:hypothetical protein
MSQLDDAKQKVYDYVIAMLGGGMIDIELDPIHLQTAFDRALGKYRQRGDSSVEESYMFMTLETDVNTYTMPKEVVNVRQLFRRSIGSRTGGGDGGSLFEPFNMAYTNTYLLSSSNMGGLATYEIFAQYQEMVGRMFGSFINYNYNQSTRKLTILQRPRGQEQILVWTYNYRPDFVILEDIYANQWIKDYTLANCKMMMGEAREKFAQIAGPQGGSSLNGTALKSEAKEMITALETELMQQVTGGQGYTFIIG